MSEHINSIIRGDYYYATDDIIERLTSLHRTGKPRFAFCKLSSNCLFGMDNGNVTVAILSFAILPNTNYSIKYEIKWDGIGSRPGGNHLGQGSGALDRRYVEDFDANGIPITTKQSDSSRSCFFKTDYGLDTVFLFNDRIVQDSSLVGKWWFKLSVFSPDNCLLTYDEIEIDWTNRTVRNLVGRKDKDMDTVYGRYINTM